MSLPMNTTTCHHGEFPPCVHCQRNEIATLRQRAERAEAELAAMGNLLPGYLYMDPPDGGDVPLVEQVRRMSVDAAIGRKIDALRDFANEMGDEDCEYGDGCPSNAGARHGTCRPCKARAALSNGLAAQSTIADLTGQVERLREALAEAIESVEDWAGYASEYFRQKHGLEEELARFRAALGDSS